MPDSINHTHLALISKSENASRVQHFRPISLCNIVYKIISKFIATRPKAYLQRMTSPFQSAFIKGRLIQENSIVAFEALHSIKKKRGKRGLMAYKADMEKVFDQIEWQPIILTLRNFGFPIIFISWILFCLSTTFFSILLNGSNHGYFNSSRGLRQGVLGQIMSLCKLKA